MSTPVSVSSNTAVRPAKTGKDPPPKLKKRHIISIFVILILLVIIVIIVFGLLLLFSQSTSGNNAKQVFIEHKSNTIDSVTTARQSIQRLPNFAEDVTFDDLPMELSNLVYTTLDLDRLKSKLPEEIPDSDYAHLETMLQTAKACPPPKNSNNVPLLTEKNEVLQLLNGPMKLYEKELDKINGPIAEAISKFNSTIITESSKTGRISKRNLATFSKNMTNMLSDYQNTVETKDDSYIKAYEKQNESRELSELYYLLFCIAVLTIVVLLYVVLSILFVCFQKSKLSEVCFDRILNIHLTVSCLLAFGLLIFAILASIGISPFLYDCILESDVENSHSKFYNYNGEAVNIETITNTCDNQTVYSKMKPYLNADKMTEYLDNCKSEVSNISTTLESIEFDISVGPIGTLITQLDVQYDEFYKRKSCIKGSMAVATYQVYLQNLKTRADALRDLKPSADKITTQLTSLNAQIVEFIQSSFANLTIVSGDVANSINSALRTTDFSCHQEMPRGICGELENNMRRQTIVNWLMFGASVVLVIFSMMIRCFAKIVKQDAKVTNVSSKKF